MLEQILKERNVVSLPTVTNENWSEESAEGFYSGRARYLSCRRELLILTVQIF